MQTIATNLVMESDNHAKYHYYMYILTCKILLINNYHNHTVCISNLIIYHIFPSFLETSPPD